MNGSNMLGRALLEALGAEDLAAFADRLRPFLVDIRETSGEPLLSCAQAANHAGVHVETIRRAIRAGTLTAAGVVGRSPRIALSDLDTWLAAPLSRRRASSHALAPRSEASQRPQGSPRRPLANALAPYDRPGKDRLASRT